MLKRRSMMIFYFLVAYIFISFSWWVLLLIRINNEAYTEKRELLHLNFIYQNRTIEDFVSSTEMNKIEKERRRKVYMIAGEGIVFLLILVFMTIMVNRSLSREVNVMRQQKNFLLSITHELRSPIASARVAMQTLVRHRHLPDEKYESLLQNSISDMDRLQTLVENLLLAAKIEDHTFNISHDACDFSELLNDILRKTESQFGQVRNFIRKIPPKIYVNGDRMALTSVINNLLENAIKYSAEHSNITIVLNEEADKVVMKIIDEGIGISEEEKKKVFQKFYRVGQEETRQTKGTGLGLFIVEKVLRMHRGSISIGDNQPAGTVFSVQLPRLT